MSRNFNDLRADGDDPDIIPIERYEEEHRARQLAALIANKDVSPYSKCKRYSMLLALFCVSMCNLMDRYLLVFLYSIPVDGLTPEEAKYQSMRVATDMSATQFGILSGPAFMAVFAAGVIAAGYVADNYHRKYAMALGLTVWSGAVASMGFANSFWLLLLSRFVQAAGQAFAPPLAYSLIASYFTKEERGFANGFFSSAIFIGYGMSALSLVVLPHLGWRNVCYVFGALGAVWLITLLTVVVETPRVAPPPQVNAAEEEEKEEKDDEEDLVSDSDYDLEGTNRPAGSLSYVPPGSNGSLRKSQSSSGASSLLGGATSRSARSGVLSRVDTNMPAGTSQLVSSASALPTSSWRYHGRSQLATVLMADAMRERDDDVATAADFKAVPAVRTHVRDPTRVRPGAAINDVNTTALLADAENGVDPSRDAKRGRKKSKSTRCRRCCSRMLKPVAAMRSALNTTTVRLAVLGASVRMVGGLVIGSFLPEYFRRRFPDQRDEYAVLNAVVIALSGTLSALIGGRICDYWSQRSSTTHSERVMHDVVQILQSGFVYPDAAGSKAQADQTDSGVASAGGAIGNADASAGVDGTKAASPGAASASSPRGTVDHARVRAYLDAEQSPLLQRVSAIHDLGPYSWVPAIGTVVSLPLLIGCLIVPNLYAAMAFLFLFYVFAECWFGPLFVIVAHYPRIAPAVKGMAMAMIVSMSGLFGSIGPVVVGVFDDQIGDVRWELILGVVIPNLLSGLIFLVLGGIQKRHFQENIDDLRTEARAIATPPPAPVVAGEENGEGVVVVPSDACL